MKFMRNHWYDLGGFLAVPAGYWIVLNFNAFSPYQMLMWCSLVSLFLHQLEEYRLVGTFPGMINTKLYRSDAPERFPLNTQTSLVINVGLGWTSYLLAAIAAERAVWLGLATILVSAGNVIAHVIFFNVRGKMCFNAGMTTALLLFLPIVVIFFRIVLQGNLAGPVDYIAGIALGVLMNVVGVVKMIDWMARPDSPFAFSARQMLKDPARRKPETAAVTD